MKKKLLTVALAATMAVSSVFTASAADYYTNASFELKTNDSYTEVANPLLGKVGSKVVISYTVNWTADAAKNGWDGIFSFYDATSTARVSFQTAPYICYNSGVAEKFIDAKADAWCTANCEAGKDYTFVYTITADAITVTCDGTAISAFAETKRGTAAAAGYQEILDALNTYPTLTLGVGLAKSSYWNTELCTVTNLKISDGSATTTDPTTAADGATTDTPKTDTPKTGDVATTATVVMMVGAAAVVVALKKKTIAE